MSTALGIDPGASTGIAVVHLGDDRVLRCSLAVAAHGKKWQATVTETLAYLQPGVAFIERPADKVRAVGARHHVAMFGLGRRFGRLEQLLLDRGHEVRPVTTSEWWAALPLRLTGKRGDGLHRVHEASSIVQGASAWLDGITATHQPDAAEAILLAAAGCLLLGREK
ncbi:MAG: hypothetical protein FJ090_14800 [Deltaproteobacteria bacterium]|nr:hypothetical protein [Deltaproteobacteria bacterium]